MPDKSATKSANKSATKSAPQPTTILLVRHAETPTTNKVLPGRAAGLELSERGIAQAEATAVAIASSAYQVAAIYASPLERAQQTAAAISAAVNRKVRTHEGLNECDFGRWTGRSLKALYKVRDWRKVQHSPSNFRFPGGESFTEMQNRMVSALDEIAGLHKGKAVVAVSHADTIKAAVAHCLGMHLDMFQRLHVSPASVTTVRLMDGFPSVVSLNCRTPG